MLQELTVPPALESALLAPPRRPPRVEHLEPFFRAARDVLGYELGSVVERGDYSVARETDTTHDVTAIVGITGELIGLAFCAMNHQTAKGLVERLIGEPVAELDDLALSAITELANVIAGRAAGLLADVGLNINITPPVLVSGVGSRFSTSGIPRVLVAMKTELGAVEIQLAIKSAP